MLPTSPKPSLATAPARGTVCQGPECSYTPVGPTTAMNTPLRGSEDSSHRRLSQIRKFSDDGVICHGLESSQIHGPV